MIVLENGACMRGVKERGGERSKQERKKEREKDHAWEREIL